MCEASLPFALLPGYLKFLASTTAVTFKIPLWGVFPGVEWAESTPFPDRHPADVPPLPCSPGMEQQWEGPCTAWRDASVSITG